VFRVAVFIVRPLASRQFRLRTHENPACCSVQPLHKGGTRGSCNLFFLCVLCPWGRGGCFLYVQEQANFLFRTCSVAKLTIIDRESCQKTVLLGLMSHFFSLSSCLIKTKLRGLSSRAKYTDRATAACQKKLVPFFADRECHVVSVKDPDGCIFDFLDRTSRIQRTQINWLPANSEYEHSPNVLT
jgi:hypothetical protein